MKKITAMLLAGAMIFTLAACGSKEEPAAPAPAPSAPAASAPAAAPSDDPYADLDEVVQLSDRIAVIYEGKFVYETPADVLTDVELGLLMTGGSVEELKGAAHEV